MLILILIFCLWFMNMYIFMNTFGKWSIVSEPLVNFHHTQFRVQDCVFRTVRRGDSTPIPCASRRKMVWRHRHISLVNYFAVCENVPPFKRRVVCCFRLEALCSQNCTLPDPPWKWANRAWSFTKVCRCAPGRWICEHKASKRKQHTTRRLKGGTFSQTAK